MSLTSLTQPLHDDLKPDEPRLTTSMLLRFSWPLALTFLMMSGAAPLVSNGITWMHDAEGERVHLSAFLMTFVSALFIYSPMFIARNVAVRTITDRRSLWSFVRFFVFWALVSSALLGTVSLSDAAGELVFGTLLGGTDQQVALARGGLLCFLPIPVLVALRGLGQGCHIINGQTGLVGVGTGLRFLAMAAFVFGIGIHHDLSGPTLGGLTYLTGIGSETLFVLVMLAGKPQLKRREHAPLVRFTGYARYAGPLMLGSMCHQLNGPVLIHIINRAGNPTVNGAAFNLIRDTVWIMVSVLMAVQPVVIALATSRRNLRKILRFATGTALLISLFGAILALTPLRHAIFVGWLRVDNGEILALTYRCLFWLIPVPAIAMVNHLLMAMHTRSGRTVWVTLGNAVGLSLLLGIAIVPDLSVYSGAVLAIMGQAGAQLASALVQSLGLMSGGVRSVIDRRSMAEKLETPQGIRHAAGAIEELVPPASAVQPVPERIQT